MDFTALEIFKAVAAEGSVTCAAEQLGCVQSNVTTRIQQLEEQLAPPLFLRHGRRMVPTPAGESRAATPTACWPLAEEARQAVRPQQPGGRLRLGAMESTQPQRAAPAAGATACPVARRCWTCPPTLPTTGGAVAAHTL